MVQSGNERSNGVGATEVSDGARGGTANTFVVIDAQGIRQRPSGVRGIKELERTRCSAAYGWIRVSAQGEHQWLNSL